MATFEAAIDAWVRATQERVTAVVRQSAQDVFRAAQVPVAQGGDMPVVTGFLRNSLATSLNGGSPDVSGADSYVLQIARMAAGDAVLGAWTAEYARKVHFGEGGRPGRFWVTRAAAQWQQIVKKNAAELRRRVGS